MRRAGVFVFFFLLGWILLYAIDHAFPYLKPGSDIIFDAKLDYVARERIFDPERSLRVVAVGNSITLSGFHPTWFDDGIGGDCQSFNLGLPASAEYVEPLEAMVARGDVPTHVLVQASWPDFRPELGLLERLRSDRRMIRMLFPFRDLPRNLAILLIVSTRRGGPCTYYRAKREIAHQVLAERGYYFIEGQSRYPDDRLPDDFSLLSDRPNVQHRRSLAFDSENFHRLRAMAEHHNIHFIIIPEFYREKSLAEPPEINRVVARRLEAYPRFTIVGPDYYRFENRFFSDYAHLNPDGARVYTERLAALLRPLLRPETGSTGDAL